MSSALRLVIYDATQARRPPRPLGFCWSVGSRLYRTLGWIDASFGATSFAEALDWVVATSRATPLAELQFWGHGRFGRALIDRESLDRSALSPTHPLQPKLSALRASLAPDARIWFRTCETLGALPGQDFARALGDFTGARIAGHTFEIAYYQSGLRELAPGAAPAWSPTEGLAHGTASHPERSLPSRPDAPSTITCLTPRVPPSART